MILSLFALCEGKNVGAYFYFIFINQAAFLENSMKDIMDFLEAEGSLEFDREYVYFELAEFPQFSQLTKKSLQSLHSSQSSFSSQPPQSSHLPAFLESAQSSHPPAVPNSAQSSHPSAVPKSAQSPQPPQSFDRIQLKQIGKFDEFLPLFPTVNRDSRYPLISHLLRDLLSLLPMNNTPSINGYSTIHADEFKCQFLEDVLFGQFPEDVYDSFFPDGLQELSVLRRELIPAFINQCIAVLETLKGTLPKHSTIENSKSESSKIKKSTTERNPKYVELMELMRQQQELCDLRDEKGPFNPTDPKYLKFTAVSQRMIYLLHNSGDPEYRKIMERSIQEDESQEAITLIERIVGEVEKAVKDGFGDYVVILIQ
jgi:hypothetical protein